MEAKLSYYLITQMTLIVLQRQHQHGDPINGHPLENIKLNAVKHNFRYFFRQLLQLVT